jgi:hypothetical protein
MKILMILFLVAQVSLPEAFAFGPSRKTEKMFIHDNCDAYFSISGDMSHGWLKLMISERLKETSWNLHWHSDPYGRGIPDDAIWFHMHDVPVNRSGEQCRMESSLSIRATVGGYGWHPLNPNNDSYYYCMDFNEREKVITSLLEKIPHCQTVEQTVLLKKPKEEIVEKVLVEPGEAFK